MIKIEELVGKKFYYTRENIVYEVYEVLGNTALVFWHSSKCKLIEIKNSGPRLTGRITYTSLNTSYNKGLLNFC